jgi:septal ring factor EnvC (AmiA/AmiB activator)
MSETTEIAAVEEISAENAPAIYGHSKLEAFVNAAREAVSGEVPDLTTRKGRDRVASLAAQVSRSKTAVEKPGREYLKRIKELPKAIEAELREFAQQMDALRDQVRKPLDDWEAEQERIQRELEEREASIEAAIKRLHLACVTKVEDDSATLAQYLVALEAEYRQTDYGLRAEEAGVVYQASVDSLNAALASRQKYEAEQAELTELRRKQAETEQREREREIAEQAAQQARKEAEQRAENERIAAANKVREAEEAAQRAEDERLRQQEESARQLREAEERAERATEQARLDQEAQQQRERDEAAQRQANTEHRVRILTAAKVAIMATGITEDQARAVVRLIAAGKVPSVSITY